MRGFGWCCSASDASTTESYSLVPCPPSTDSARRPLSTSIVSAANPVSGSAFDPKVYSATRSRCGFAATNSRAAEVAFSSTPLSIECERSIASTTLFACDRDTSTYGAGLPFSTSFGAATASFDVSTVTRTVGYLSRSIFVIRTADAAVPAAVSAARAKQSPTIAPRLRLIGARFSRSAPADGRSRRRAGRAGSGARRRWRASFEWKWGFSPVQRSGPSSRPCSSSGSIVDRSEASRRRDPAALRPPLPSAAPR